MQPEVKKTPPIEPKIPTLAMEEKCEKFLGMCNVIATSKEIPLEQLRSFHLLQMWETACERATQSIADPKSSDRHMNPSEVRLQHFIELGAFAYKSEPLTISDKCVVLQSIVKALAKIEFAMKKKYDTTVDSRLKNSLSPGQRQQHLKCYQAVADGTCSRVLEPLVSLIKNDLKNKNLTKEIIQSGQELAGACGKPTENVKVFMSMGFAGDARYFARFLDL